MTGSGANRQIKSERLHMSRSPSGNSSLVLNGLAPDAISVPCARLPVNRSATALPASCSGSRSGRLPPISRALLTVCQGLR